MQPLVEFFLLSVPLWGDVQEACVGDCTSNETLVVDSSNDLLFSVLLVKAVVLVDHEIDFLGTEELAEILDRQECNKTVLGGSYPAFTFHKAEKARFDKFDHLLVTENLLWVDCVHGVLHLLARNLLLPLVSPLKVKCSNLQ